MCHSRRRARQLKQRNQLILGAFWRVWSRWQAQIALYRAAGAPGIRPRDVLIRLPTERRMCHSWSAAIHATPPHTAFSQGLTIMILALDGRRSTPNALGRIWANFRPTRFLPVLRRIGAACTHVATAFALSHRSAATSRNPIRKVFSGGVRCRAELRPAWSWARLTKLCGRSSRPLWAIQALWIGLDTNSPGGGPAGPCGRAILA